jgi:CBS domain containing-hemolysin-like protein
MQNTSVIPFVLLGIALVLVLLNAAFVAAEFALVKVRRTRLEELAEAGNKNARIALKCSNNPALTLSSTQLGVTLASLGLGWVGEEAFSRLFAQNPLGHVGATLLSFLSITVMHVVLGELVPKSVAIQDAERLALLLARPLRIFYAFSRPIVVLFNQIAAFVLGIIGYDKVEEDPLTEQELKLIMKDSREDGVISTGEALIIARAFEFADKKAIDIMVPRERVEFISTARSVEQNLEIITGRQHTRFPFCDGDFDQVVGIVRSKDVWPELLKELSNEHFRSRCADPIFVTQNMRQDHLMQLFQMRGAHQAVVRDTCGRNIGIVTLEDILKQLVGFVPG